jgi:hypothetical protein
MRRRGIGLVVAVAVACALPPGPVRAGEQPFLVHRTARAHYALAGKAAERGDYRVAAAELDAAYAIEPHPELLFVRAEVRRRLDECRTALILYREFIASTPSEAARKQADDGIAACEQSLAASEPPPPPVIEPPEPPEVAPVKPPPPAPKWQRDPAGGVLLGLGVAALAAAAGLGVGAALTASEANSTDSQKRHEELAPINLRLLAGTGAAVAVGVGLVVGAALRYRVVKRRGRQQLGAWFDGRGVGLALRLRF